jgi:hypothetical protein
VGRRFRRALILLRFLVLAVGHGITRKGEKLGGRRAGALPATLIPIALFMAACGSGTDSSTAAVDMSDTTSARSVASEGVTAPVRNLDVFPVWLFMDGELVGPSTEFRADARPTRALTGNLGPTASISGSVLVYAEVEPVTPVDPSLSFGDQGIEAGQLLERYSVRVIDGAKVSSISGAYGAAISRNGTIAYAAFAAGDGYRASVPVTADLYVQVDGDSTRWSSQSGRWIPAGWADGVLLAYLSGEGGSELPAFSGPGSSTVIPGFYLATSDVDQRIIVLNISTENRIATFDTDSLREIDSFSYELPVALSYLGAFDRSGRIYAATDTDLWSIEIDHSFAFNKDSEFLYSFGPGNFVGGIEPSMDDTGMAVIVEQYLSVAEPTDANPISTNSSSVLYQCTLGDCSLRGVVGDPAATTLVRVVGP